jgi:hypothetical protein
VQENEMEGMELIIFGDIKANLTGALLLSGFGLFFSIMVCCLMVYPSMAECG